jgi:hypothetical protein
MAALAVAMAGVTLAVGTVVIGIVRMARKR